MIVSIRKEIICRCRPHHIITGDIRKIQILSYRIFCSGSSNSNNNSDDNVIKRIINNEIKKNIDNNESIEYVKIGSIKYPLKRNNNNNNNRLHLKTKGYLSSFPTTSTPTTSAINKHLQWMLKKDMLKQDMLLIGSSNDDGSSRYLRRNLALSYGELTKRNVQIVTITSDLTESDLKQRRELVICSSSSPSSSSSSSSSTANNNSLQLSFVDSAPVEAALNGDILILDGIEKASKNVLPTLNNLLEHREMNLEDGRFLVSQDRFNNNNDTDNNKNKMMMIPVHDDFRVIATTSISSDTNNNSRNQTATTIDPPLRSRFQIRRIDFNAQDYYYHSIINNNTMHTNDNNNRIHKQLFSLINTLEYASRHQNDTNNTSNSNIWPFPIHHIPKLYHMLDKFNNVALHSEKELLDIIKLYYPLIDFYNDNNDYCSDDTTSKNEIQDEYFASSTKAFFTAWNEIIMKQQKNKKSKNKKSWYNSLLSKSSQSSSNFEYKIGNIQRDMLDDKKANVIFEVNDANGEKQLINLKVPCGPYSFQNDNNSNNTNYHLTKGLQKVIQSMIQSHANNSDMILLSPPGQGKTSTISYFASLLGYKTQIIHMHPEQTFTDFFVRRITDKDTGETKWESTLLLQAMQNGNVIIVLDHIDKLRHDVLSSLQSLCLERDVFLPDGRRIARKDRYDNEDHNDNNDNNKEYNKDVNDKIIHVHPSFRIVGLASSVNNNISSWYTEDVMSMFSTIILPTPTNECLHAILQSVIMSLNNNDNSLSSSDSTVIINKLLDLHTKLTPEVAEDCGVTRLSTRNSIRIVRRIFSSTSQSSISSKDNYHNNNISLHEAICEILVADLLPPTQRAALESLLQRAGIVQEQEPKQSAYNNTSTTKTIQIDKEYCTIGKHFQFKRKVSKRIEMVPSPKFFDIPNHVTIIQDLLHDWNSGERAFLLLGNQGVGKNMIVDRLCQAANFEREYIQLHRDSTVGQLTIQPTLVNGKVVWKDENSPFMRAVTNGHVLVIDEADKSPVEVLAVLKGLIEDKEMIIGDGRRVCILDEDQGNESDSSIIPIHKDFTLVVLANRPGYPFLGNAFLKTIGDVFSIRVIGNPDLNSEIQLLSSYGPNVKSELIKRIAASFAELRSLSDHGEIYYPYSTREAVAVIRHLESFKDDDVVTALHNVLDFDSFYNDMYATIGKVFRKHGIAVQDYAQWQEAILKQDQRNHLQIEYLKGNSSSSSTGAASSNPPPLSTPKEGKWDENNDPHVGGNTWAGGTGGSDTAGLGGRGGPYRLDRGHTVHQVSDEMKNQVSAEAARTAKTIAQEALNERLSDINMSEQEWSQYKRFVDPIRKDIANLRAILAQTDITQKEVGWMKRQIHGELDEARLVEGVTGDKHIYKRRGALESGPLRHAKKMRFVVDVSGSMYRFNGYDNRLYRCLEATNLIMESLQGMQHRFDYSIVGHSGDSACIPFVNFGEPPKTEKDKMKVLQIMMAHSQYCQAGDYTLEAIEKAIYDIQQVDNNMIGNNSRGDSLVVAFSDANLERYGIHPRELARIMEQKQQSANDVKAHCIFIASFGEEADLIKRELPVGRGHICMQTNELPRIVKNILARHI